MDLETYIQSLIEHSQSYMGKAQIQRVISHHILLCLPPPEKPREQQLPQQRVM